MKYFLTILIICGIISSHLSYLVSADSEDIKPQIDRSIQLYQQNLWRSQTEIQEIEEKLSPLQNQKASLESQLRLFEEQISLLNSKLLNVEIQINQKKLELAKLEEILERGEIEIQEEKSLMAKFIRLIYWEEKKYLNTENNNFQLIKLLFSNQTISQTLRELEFLTVLEKISRQIFIRLSRANEQFSQEKNNLNSKKEELSRLKNILEKEKISLLAQKEGREQILKITQGQEAEYQKILNESKLQAAESVLAMARLQNHQDLINEKLAGINELNDGQNRQFELFNKLLENNTSLDQYNLNNLIPDLKLNSRFMWPVAPSKGISAYYHDPAYQKYFGVKHNAIDIRVPQKTLVYAPANAYVEKIADNGMGYSYVILGHKEGFSTLYGHISEIMVKEGDILQMGDIIGKSGGTPGTKGAGVMTTGPHLHFEVYLNGKHVNPLDYLPLELLPSKK